MALASRHKALHLAQSCALMMILSAPVVVPPVNYKNIAQTFGIVQAHVTALMPAAYAVGALFFSMPASLFMERFGLRTSFRIGVVFQCLSLSLQVVVVQFWQLVRPV